MTDIDVVRNEQDPSFKGVVIPKGFELVLVKIGDSDKVEPTCPTCGGSSFHTSPSCDFCGNSRTHYEYRKEGGDDKKVNHPEVLGKMPKKISVDDGNFDGMVRAEEVRIGADSVVGSIEAGDNTYMANGSKAGFVHSPIITAEGDIEVSYLATSQLDVQDKASLTADVVTVYDGGEINLQIGSKIRELRLGKNVREPAWFLKFTINKIVHDDFPKPKNWEK